MNPSESRSRRLAMALTVLGDDKTGSQATQKLISENRRPKMVRNDALL
jgi:uncharacterized protein YgbK (DUF1537 family)